MTQLRRDGYHVCSAGKCFSSDGSVSCAHSDEGEVVLEILETPLERFVRAVRECMLEQDRCYRERQWR